MLINSGFKHYPETGQARETANTFVFEFPIKSPENSVVKTEMTALDQLEFWKMYKEAWCEHNPSCTIYVKEDEWLVVGAWVYENWEYIGGLSFLPDDGGVYVLAPYEEISEVRYDQLVQELPSVDWSYLSLFEQSDETEGAKELACSGGSCEL
jgi:ribonucleoside-diphosphate reductase alpha chain